MKKYLFLALIVIVIVGGLLTLFWFYPGIFPFGKNNNESTQNINQMNANSGANENTNKAAVNLNISLKKGSIDVNKSVTYKEVEFKVLTADKLDKFENQTAGAGKNLVVLYVQRIADSKITEIFSWLKNELKLKNDQGQDYALKSLSFVGESAPDYAASYFIFETGGQDKGFTLNFGSGDNFQNIDLGF